MASVSRPTSLKLNGLTGGRGSALATLNSPDPVLMQQLLSASGGSAEGFILSPGNAEEIHKFVMNPYSASPLTPMSFLNPKNVTFDQEQFANYFSKKVSEIKEERDGLKENTNSEEPQFTDISYSGQCAHQYEVDQAADGQLLSASTDPMTCDIALQQVDVTTHSSAPGSTISSTDFCGSSEPSHYGRDLDSRSMSKLERKRARNRDAARKCRERKLSVISKLEREKASLVEVNKTLSVRMRSYQTEVQNLKRFVIDHLNNGCKIAKLNSSS